MFRLRGADGLDIRLSFTARGQYIGGPCVARHVPGTLRGNPANCGLTSAGGPIRGSLKGLGGPGRLGGLEWRVESQIGPATPQDIAVEQAAPTLDALAVDEGPVSREPVVDDRPVIREPRELGMNSRDVRIPGEGDIGAHAAADRDSVPRVGQREDALAIPRVRVDEVGIAAPSCLGELRRFLGCGPFFGHARYSTTVHVMVQAEEPAHADRAPLNVSALHRLDPAFTGSGFP